MLQLLASSVLVAPLENPCRKWERTEALVYLTNYHLNSNVVGEFAFWHWIGNGVDFWGEGHSIPNMGNCLLPFCSPCSDFDFFLPQTEENLRKDRTRELSNCEPSFFPSLGPPHAQPRHCREIKRLLVACLPIEHVVLLGDTDSLHKFLIFLTWL
eukprot:TRINITY_DN18214_c0_g1_i1.p1 TRINITY_DN18214_c0_g1~~TRINITY_DN18214_c0_g1_i1.p1  ORF type:complete len:155 (+),score=22.04 TRINITY_DN18214_c0_g1_i1:2490-2954(+)